MEKRRSQKISKRRSECIELKNLVEGNESIKSFLMSKEQKVNRITKLNKSIQDSELDIECLGLLHKIVVL